MVANELVQLGQLGAAADEARQTTGKIVGDRFRTVRARRIRRDGSEERRVLTQDPLLHLAQMRTGLEPTFVAEDAPRALKRDERFGLAALSVEALHQQRPQLLVPPELRHECFEVGDDLAKWTGPGAQLEFGQVVKGGLPHLAEQRDGRLEDEVSGQICERFSSPEGQRVPIRAKTVCAVAVVLGASMEQLLEEADVGDRLVAIVRS